MFKKFAICFVCFVVTIFLTAVNAGDIFGAPKTSTFTPIPPKTIVPKTLVIRLGGNEYGERDDVSNLERIEKDLKIQAIGDSQDVNYNDYVIRVQTIARDLATRSGGTKHNETMNVSLLEGEKDKCSASIQAESILTHQRFHFYCDLRPYGVPKKISIDIYNKEFWEDLLPPS